MKIKISRPKGLTAKILWGMGLGLFVGAFLHNYSHIDWVHSFLTQGIFYVGGQVFIASLKVLVVPLVFVSLVCGTASLDDITKLGRVGVKTLGLYLLTTAVAISLALFLAYLLNPGQGFDLSTSAAFTPKASPPLVETLINIFPSNPFKAMVEANMLQIIVFAGMFGVAISLTPISGPRILNFFNDLNEVIMKMITLIMNFAPIGVFCLLANVFAQQGFEAIIPLGKYFFVVLAALAVHVLITYFGILKLFAKLSPFHFFNKFKSVPAFAFSTSSSNATIPVTLETVEEKLGVDKTIASFTIPLGATINMDGTAIMQGVATLFIAQAYNIHIGFAGAIKVVLMATLASVGTAGVPGVGLITLAMVLREVNLPVEGIALIIGVDRLLDMLRTVVNVTGDAIVSLVVAKSENKFDVGVFNEK